MRLIDADVTEKIMSERYRELAKEYGHYDHYTTGYGDALSVIEDSPTIEAEPVKHGRWGTNSDRPDSLICSVCNCGFDMWKHDPHNYCPNCGAKMDLEG